jgi:hypothetical protein
LKRFFALCLLLSIPATFLAAESADPFRAPIGEKIVTGGNVSPDGKVEVQVDLSASSGLRLKNVGGRDGSGLCVFTSITHSARYQNEHRLWNFQTDMRKEMGGGYPEKVDKMIAKYGAGTPYLQFENGDPHILMLALKTGRMPGVTYNGHDNHYSGTIGHMVNLVALTGLDDAKDWAAILDNNFVGPDELEWMRPSDFLQRWKGSGGGWAVVLLNPPPPPVPHSAS